MNNRIERPLDDHSRSLYTFLFINTARSHNLTFLFTLFSFKPKNRYNDFPATTKIPEEKNNALLSLILPHFNTFDTCTNSNHNFIQPPFASSYVLQTVNPDVCKNSVSCRTENFVTEILFYTTPSC